MTGRAQFMFDKLAIILIIYLLHGGAAFSQAIDPQAQSYFEKGQKARSLSDKIENFQKALAIHPDFKEAAYRLGVAQFQKGEYAEAIENLRRAQSEHGKPFKGLKLYLRNAYTFHTAQLRAQNKFEDALSSVNNALNLDPNYAPAYAELGLTYYDLQAWPAAIQALETSAQLNENQEVVWNKLSDLYLRTGDYFKSITACEKALKIDPNLKDAQANLEKAKSKTAPEAILESFATLENEGKIEEGVALLRQAQSHYPEHEKINAALQQALQEQVYQNGLQAFENENWSLAIEFFQSIDSTYGEAAVKLAEARASLAVAQDTSLAEFLTEPSATDSEESKPPTKSSKKPLVTESETNKSKPVKPLLASSEPLISKESSDTVVEGESEDQNETSSNPEKGTKQRLSEKTADTNPPAELNPVPAQSGGSNGLFWTVGIVLGSVAVLGLLFVGVRIHPSFKSYLKSLKLRSKSNSIKPMAPVDRQIENEQTNGIFKDRVASVTPVQFDKVDTGDILTSEEKSQLEETPELENTEETLDETQTILGGIKQVKRIGRYIVESEIGRGSMGLIYKAWDPKLDRTVVIKQVAYDFTTNLHEITNLKDRLFREARAAGRLTHPNIVVIYDVDDENDFSYIVMEYLQGQDLKQVLEKESRITFARSLKIVHQICKALHFAHENDIVHRDIKPSNIILTQNDNVKVADFGIAQMPHLGTLTQTGSIIGTPYYMSPEQIEGRNLDGRSDIFSVGVILYEMLTGIHPFDGDNIPTVVYKIVHVQPEEVTRINPELPSAIEPILQRALAKDSEDRYATAKELLKDLETCQKDLI
ncbi:MAG: protein kinase [bacterium]